MKWRTLSLLSLSLLTPVVAAEPGLAQSREQMLVTADWLKQHINDRNLVLLHVGEKPEFDAEHLPGARFITMRDVSTGQAADYAVTGLSTELPTPEAARAKLESLGISDDSRIIVYYGKDWVSPSTRIILTLDWLGLSDRTSLLDGGMPAWKRAGGQVTSELAAVTPGKLSVKPVKTVTIDKEFVNANRGKAGFALIDARSPVMYDGIQPGMTKKGHIPGAKNLPFNTFHTEENILKSATEIRDMFARAGVKPGDTIMAYCHLGQQATVVVFAARTLGYKVLLYDGSFHNWEKYDLPVEITPPKGQ